MEPQRILFVCTGNSCRSVMAQGLLQHRLKQVESRLREPIEVLSAGTGAMEGMGASRETVELLQKKLGVDMSGHFARRLTPTMIKQATVIFAMEEHHLEETLRKAPEAKGKTFLLRNYGLTDPLEMGDPNIPDPVGKPMEIYEVCLDRKSVV